MSPMTAPQEAARTALARAMAGVTGNHKPSTYDALADDILTALQADPDAARAVVALLGGEGRETAFYRMGEMAGRLAERNGVAAAPQDDREAETLRAFAESIDKTISEAGIGGRFIAGTLLDVRWVPEVAVAEALALIPGLPCPMRSSITDQPCTLPWGHPQASPTRFHKFAARPPLAPESPEPLP